MYQTVEAVWACVSLYLYILLSLVVQFSCQWCCLRANPLTGPEGAAEPPPCIPPHDAGTEAAVRECLGLQQGVEVMFQGGSQIHWLLWGWVVLLASEGPGSC